MTQNYDKLCSRFLGRKFDAANLGRLDDISGHANHEQVTHPLVENQFRRHP